MYLSVPLCSSACSCVPLRLLLLGLVEDEGEAALAAVLSVKVGRHEDPRAAVLVGTLAAQARYLPVLVHLATDTRTANQQGFILGKKCGHFLD